MKLLSFLFALLQRFLLLGILVFAAVFCWLNRDILQQAARLSSLQWVLVIGGYFGCYWLNALMACQVQWRRGTHPGLWEMLCINSYASILGFVTVMRAGFYGGKLWFYQQRFGLSATLSLGLQGWVSLVVLAANAGFGLCYGIWLQFQQGVTLSWVYWVLVPGTLLLVAVLVGLLLYQPGSRCLPDKWQSRLADIKGVVTSTSAGELLPLVAEALLNIPLQALSFGVLCAAFDLEVPVPYLLLMALLANLSLIIALTPSNLGVKELVLWQLLTPLQLSQAALLGVMLVDRVLQLATLAVISALGYRLLQKPAAVGNEP